MIDKLVKNQVFQDLIKSQKILKIKLMMNSIFYEFIKI
jgi:hypothetical protein